MILFDIVTLLIPFIGIGFWVAIQNTAEKEARKQLGEDVVEIRLYRKWSYITDRVLVALAVAIPVTITVVGIINKIDAGELFIEIARSLSIAAGAFTLRRASRLLIGTRGFAYGAMEMVTWDRVEGLVWDRDIKQQLWGVMLTVRDKKYKKTTTKMRLYVRRDLKEEVERLLNEFRNAAGVQELLAAQASPQLASAIS